jgi:hypothetical protein
MSIRSRFLDLVVGPQAPAGPLDLRVDSTSSTSDLSGAAIQNPLSGIGGYRDSGAQGRPNVQRDYLAEDELVALMRGGLYRRIVQLHPSWSTLRFAHITDSTDDERPLAKAMNDLGVRSVFRRADTWGRGLGECLVLMVTDDPDDLDQPLRPEKVRKVHRLEVFDRREFVPIRFNSDIFAGPIGDPTHYTITPQRNSFTDLSGGKRRWSLNSVHASRLLRFYGDDLPPSELAYSNSYTWGADAIGQTLWDAVRNLSQTGQAGARVAQELSIAVFKVAPPKGAGDQAAAWMDKMRLLNMMKSVAQAVMIAPGEEFQRIAANPTGYKDISEAGMKELALNAGAPLTLLFGEAPGGLNTDGTSWQSLWYQSVADWQQDRYIPPMRQLVEVLYYADGRKPPEEWEIEFDPLGDLTEKELADIRLVHTQADTAAIMDGVLTPDEIRVQRYAQPGGYQSSMQPVDDEPEQARTPTPDDPEAEAATRTMIEEALAARGDASEETLCLLVPVPTSGLDEHQEWKAKAEGVVGPLAHGESPHVTVLYLGDVDPSRDPEVELLARPITEAMTPKRMVASGLQVLGTAAVLEHDSWTLRDLNEQLLRALSHLVTAKQFPGYRCHETLGYSSTMSPEAVGQLLELQRDWATERDEAKAPGWIASRLELRRGDRVVATFPFLGRQDDDGGAGE